MTNVPPPSDPTPKPPGGSPFPPSGISTPGRPLPPPANLHAPAATSPKAENNPAPVQEEVSAKPPKAGKAQRVVGCALLLLQLFAGVGAYLWFTRDSWQSPLAEQVQTGGQAGTSKTAENPFQHIGTSKPGEISPEEHEALWKLAAMESKAIPLEALQSSAQDTPPYNRALAGAGRGFRAAAGLTNVTVDALPEAPLDAQTQPELAAQAVYLANLLTHLQTTDPEVSRAKAEEALGILAPAIAQATEVDGLYPLCWAVMQISAPYGEREFGALIPKLWAGKVKKSPAVLAIMERTLVDALAVRNPVEASHAVIYALQDLGTYDTSYYQVLLTAILSLGGNLPEHEAGFAAGAILDVMIRPENNTTHLVQLGEVLLQMDYHLPSGHAWEAARMMLREFESDSAKPERLELHRLLLRLAPRLPDFSRATEISLLLKFLQRTADPAETARLGEQLADRCARITPDEAPATLEAIRKALANQPQPESLRQLQIGLGIAAAKSTPQEGEAIAKELLEGIKTSTDVSDVAARGRALGGLGPNLPAPVASEAAQVLIAKMREVDQARGEGYLTSCAALAEALGGLSFKLTGTPETNGLPAEAATLLLGRLKETKSLAATPRAELALASLASALSSPWALEAAGLILNEVSAAKPEADLSHLSKSLQLLAAKLASEEGASLAKQLIAGINDPKKPVNSVQAMALALHSLENPGPAEIMPLILDSLPAQPRPEILAELAHQVSRDHAAASPVLLSALKTARDKSRARDLALALAAGSDTYPELTEAAKYLVQGIGAATASAEIQPLGHALFAIAVKLPDKPETVRLALASALLYDPPLGNATPWLPDPKLNGWLQAREVPEIVELLKWPVATGEGCQAMVRAIEMRAEREFGRRVREFIVQAPEMALSTLESPAVRPTAAKALAELEN